MPRRRTSPARSRSPETRKRYDTLGANWKHGAPFDAPPGWSDAGNNIHFEFGGPGGSAGDFFSAFMGGR
jgi:curved DNA-binding protein